MRDEHELDTFTHRMHQRKDELFPVQDWRKPAIPDAELERLMCAALTHARWAEAAALAMALDYRHHRGINVPHKAAPSQGPITDKIRAHRAREEAMTLGEGPFTPYIVGPSEGFKLLQELAVYAGDERNTLNTIINTRDVKRLILTLSGRIVWSVKVLVNAEID